MFASPTLKIKKSYVTLFSLLACKHSSVDMHTWCSLVSPVSDETFFSFIQRRRERCGLNAKPSRFGYFPFLLVSVAATIKNGNTKNPEVSKYMSLFRLVIIFRARVRFMCALTTKFFERARIIIYNIHL